MAEDEIVLNLQIKKLDVGGGFWLALVVDGKLVSSLGAFHDQECDHYKERIKDEVQKATLQSFKI